MTVMDPDTLEMADQQALRLRRLELRAMADAILDAMRGMPEPKTWLDVGRTLRALATADRTLTQLYLPPRRGRARPAKPQPAADTPPHEAPKDTPVAAETHGLARTGTRPPKDTRHRLNRSVSAFATAMPEFTTPMPVAGKGPLPFTTPPPRTFRPGKPDFP
jgi:hypothetical protein